MSRLWRRRAFVIEMSRPLIAAAGALLLLGGAVAWRLNERSAPEIPFETKSKPPPSAPLCPWREPSADLSRFFPAATRYEVETRILSGLREELAVRLGRPPTGDENALHLYRVYRDQAPIGNVLTGRVKGEHGALELVLATDPGGSICGLRLQRLREPEPVAQAVQDPKWLASFNGRRAGDEFQPGRDIADVAAEARVSALAVAEGARSLLILLAAADETAPRGLHH
jgi:hypothetical protein